MAATKLIALHQNKGLTLGETLDKRCKYIENPIKTEQGELVTGYAVNPEMAAQEFLLSKREYEHKTGRNPKGDIIGYQIRQSFKPGEITPEEANRIGYETAMRFTKGKHAFVVCTHTDRPHIHNHIMFNSVDLKCEKKFHNFFYSGIALQRLSDIICLENGLSVIVPRKPSDRDKHPFEKEETIRDRLRTEIDKALAQQPRDFEEFLLELQCQNYEIKRGKYTAARAKDGKRFIRLRSLGDGYKEADILEKIAAVQKGNPRKVRAEKKQDFDMLLSIQDIIAKGKGPGYELWAKKYNIKNLAKALIFFQENDIRTYEELARRADDSAKRFTELSNTIKAAEKRMDEISELKSHIINYAQTIDVYKEYRKSGYSKKFYQEHEAEIIKNKAARERFKAFNGKKIPTAKQLNEEFQECLVKKRAAYSEYHEAKEKMQLYKTAKYDIDRILQANLKQEKALSSRRERGSVR